MATFASPGTVVQETVTAQNSATGVPTSPVAAFVGIGNRGPTSPTLVSSFGQFKALFGDFTNSTYLSYAAYTFFQNSGASAYFVRVANASQVAASRVLNDRAGTPLPTLKISAANPGAWGNSIYIDIVAGSLASNFTVVVHCGDATSNTIVEQFIDLSMVTTDSRYAPTIINSLSAYISAADQSSATAAPNNNPALQSGTSLAGGADGTAPTPADVTSAVNTLSTIDASIVLNLPGISDSTNVNNTLTFAASQGNIFVVIDSLSGLTSSTVVTNTASYTASSYGAVYWPWIKINDPAVSAPNITKVVPPGGSVVGAVINSDQVSGPWKTPAGRYTILSGAVGLESTLVQSDYDATYSAVPPVNGLKVFSGSGVSIWGGRTLKGGYSDKYVAIRRALIYFEQNLKDITQYAIFEPNDERLWSSLASTCSKFLTDVFQRGGLRGDTPGQAFFVTCDASNNTAASIQAGVVNITVGVALEYPAEFITINIGQSQTGTFSTTSL